MKLSRRFTLTMATIALVLYAAKSARSDDLFVSEEWTMEIQPAVKLSIEPSIPLEARAAVAGEAGTVIDPAAYTRIYNSIPFNRTEYEANPNYRHDSAMEILTGHARHQTIVQHNFEHKQPVKRIPAPNRPSRILMPFNSPFSYLRGPYSFGHGSGYWGF
ncbi:MAG TPA: hypothetical protein PLY87_29400 [Planctomycetaceae bacterium]|nr:hypothetical protein [Planctomycetaceae bacterium]